ncbi:hypothetical protein ACHAXN_008680 [Cyclotella atomus]|jgi:hypothetical protein
MASLAAAFFLLAPLLSSAFICPSSTVGVYTSLKLRNVLLSTPSPISEEVDDKQVNNERDPSKSCATSLQRIISDIDGRPLTPEYLANAMGIDNVESYSCTDEDAFYGLMSNGGRLKLHPGGETAFYKRIVFDHLDHAREKLLKSPHKLVRDAKSYLVVANFLSSAGCQEMVERTGVCIPKCYDAQLEPDFDNPMSSKFTFLLEDFAPKEGWYQRWLIDDLTECHAALSAMAKIHAFYWDGSDFWKDATAAQEFESAVWKSGSYIQPKAQGADQWQKVARKWNQERWKVEEQLSTSDFWDNLGERLQSASEECGRLAHPFAVKDLALTYKRYRTFTHGDPKSANIFFRKRKDSIQVGLIDFQWSGFGLAATDIAHFMSAAVDASLLVDGGEKDLMQYYYDDLSKHLVDFGAYESIENVQENFSYDVFKDQYEIAMLDICRLGKFGLNATGQSSLLISYVLPVIAYTWSRFTESADKTDENACARTMNKTSYNKSIPAAVWLVSRCDEILKSRSSDKRSIVGP